MHFRDLSVIPFKKITDNKIISRVISQDYEYLKLLSTIFELCRDCHFLWKRNTGDPTESCRYIDSHIQIYHTMVCEEHHNISKKSKLECLGGTPLKVLDG